MKRENEFYKDGILYYSMTGFRKAIGKSDSFVRQRIKDGVIYTEKEYFGINSERTIIPYTEIDVLKEWKKNKDKEKAERFRSAIKEQYTEEVFTKKEVAEKLGVTVPTVNKYISDGKLKTVWINSPRSKKIQMRVVPVSELNRILDSKKDRFQRFKEKAIERAVPRGVTSTVHFSVNGEVLDK